MPTRNLTKLIIFGVLTGCGVEAPPPTVPGTGTVTVLRDGSEALQGSYIVAFRTDGTHLRESYSSFFAESRAHHGFLNDEFLLEPSVKSMRFLTAVNLAEESSAAGFPSPHPGLRIQDHIEPQIASLVRVDFANEEAAHRQLRLWEEAGKIYFAEPNHVSYLSQDDTLDEESESPFIELASTYDNLNRWWFDAINLADAYTHMGEQGITGSERPIVAVLDSGVDYEHPALKDNIWTNSDINAADCTNDAHGCNTTEAKRGFLGNGNVYPFGTSGPGESCFGKDANCSHGTHVAGIIAGDPEWRDERGRSAAGVCPFCRIMILKIVSNVGKKSGILDSSILAAFKYIALFRRQGSPAVRIVNASFGKFVRSRSVGLLVRIMKEKNDTILIGAAGNEDTLTMEYPAAFRDAIAVAAVDSRLNKVSFSNFGRWVDVAAPGQNILATVPGSALDTKSGTSMAAPMVSGVAGLMMMKDPKISFEEMRKWLLESADPSFYSRDHEGGFNFNYYYPKIPQEEIRQPLLGTGLLNANGAIQRDQTAGLPVFTSLDRVTAGCGVIKKAPLSSVALFLLICGLPFTVYWKRRRS